VGYRSTILSLGLVLLALAPGLSLADTAALPPPQLPKGHLQIPIIRQSTDYSCGAAAFMSLLVYWNDFDSYESSLWPVLGTTAKGGTDSRRINEAAAAFGLNSSLKEHLGILDLQRALIAGDTLILDIQAWSEGPNPPPWKDRWEDGHYVVLIGMDSTYAYVMDPSTAKGYGYIPLDELLDRWHDYEVDASGQVWRNEHLAIVIHGNQLPQARYPADPIRIQ
jgi:predicted double-glycine peptidase